VEAEAMARIVLAGTPCDAPAKLLNSNNNLVLALRKQVWPGCNASRSCQAAALVPAMLHCLWFT
jgi:hypothetical protein